MTTGYAPVAPARRARTSRVPLPRLWPVRPSDVVAALIGNGVVILAMWIRHGGPDQLTTPGGALTALGQLAALFGAYLILIQLVLMSRSPWLDQAFGMDRLSAAHRWIGFGAVWLIGAHGILTIVGYALNDRVSILSEVWTIYTTLDFVLIGTVGFTIFTLIGITSMRWARARLSYEAWFLLHLLSYVAIALAFLHQVFVGNDFIHDPLARVYWIALYVVTAALVVAFRVGGPIRLNLRHDLRVSRVAQEAPGTVSIYVIGRRLDQLAVRSGQYFIWRFLAGDLWWRGHPFSLSAAPNGEWLRITIKALGDDTRRFQRLRPGTRVFAEGPYGVLTGARRRLPKVVLIAGGIGIVPLRALLEALPAKPGDLTLLYRARHPKHLVFREEIDALASMRGAIVHYLVGRRGSPELPHDPLDVRGLRRLVPDIGEREVYVCGPIPMMRRIEDTLADLGVPRSQVHVERFAY